MRNLEYLDYKERKISGRYITLDDIENLILNAKIFFKVAEFGKSHLHKTIYKIRLGTGKKRILIWSQMHGNESTGTKAVFDLLNFFKNPLKERKLRDQILKNCTIIILPMLNPDGAEKYTRVTAQDIDLNRDAVALKAPESKLLKELLYKFKPDYCFNLHDQRPIFSVGEGNKPATISFLAPSVNVERTVTKGRMETMKIIVAMNNVLQTSISKQIGRYTDEFYPTATGDNFQKAGFNTILIEAGHYIKDYEREKTRKLNFIALLSGINQISSPIAVNYLDYYKIPNNEKKYFDTIYANVIVEGKKTIFGVYFTDRLNNKKVVYKPVHKVLEKIEMYGCDNLIIKKLEFDNTNQFIDFLNKNSCV